MSDFNITCLKFASADIDSYELVSCGKENIRFWRIKSKSLPGFTVVLDKFARNTHFTCLAFEKFGDNIIKKDKINF